jgi:glyoxylase-like metal-dependent hydrolase (beta-lactamase superfamily II)
MNGKVTTIDRGDVRLHSYMAPEDGLNVTTELIETPASIVVIDAQYVQAYADEAAEYARSLGKPLNRLIISHAHPDHFQGAGRFGVPVHALAEVRDQIAAQGDGHDPSGTVIPSAEITPTETITPGREVIDGVPFEFEAVLGAEAGVQLLIRLPEHGTLVAQDLVYDHVHLYLGNNDAAGWEKILAGLAADAGYGTVLAGHGLPTGREVFAQLTDYLQAAGDVLGAGPDAYKSAITERFPDYRIPLLLDLSNRDLPAT